MRRNIKQQYAMATSVKAAVGYVFGVDLSNASEEKFVARHGVVNSRTREDKHMNVRLVN